MIKSKRATVGHLMGVLLKAIDKKHSSLAFKAYVNDIHKSCPEKSLEECSQVALSNIGYLSGYYSPEIAKKLLDTYNTIHPIFGRAYA